MIDRVWPPIPLLILVALGSEFLCGVFGCGVSKEVFGGDDK
jgi:hypothetical protein